MTFNAKLVDLIIRLESGQMTDAEIIDLFQYLVDTGMAWELQGFYGQTATQLIRDGKVKPPKGRM